MFSWPVHLQAFNHASDDLTQNAFPYDKIAQIDRDRDRRPFDDFSRYFSRIRTQIFAMVRGCIGSFFPSDNVASKAHMKVLADSDLSKHPDIHLSDLAFHDIDVLKSIGLRRYQVETGQGAVFSSDQAFHADDSQHTYHDHSTDRAHTARHNSPAHIRGRSSHGRTNDPSRARTYVRNRDHRDGHNHARSGNDHSLYRI